MNKFAKARETMGKHLSKDFELYFSYYANVACLLQDRYGVEGPRSNEMAESILGLIFSIPPREKIEGADSDGFKHEEAT